MTLNTALGTINNVVGLAVVGGVAVKSIDFFDKQTRNVRKSTKKSKKRKGKKSRKRTKVFEPYNFDF